MQTEETGTSHSHSGINDNDALEGPSRARFYTKVLFKLGITLLLLAYLAFKIDWGQIKTTISSIHLLPFFSSYIIALLGSIPLAIRLNILLKPTVLRFSVYRLIQIQFISQFLSLMLPSGLGMTIARWYQITRNRVGRRVFIVITLIERVMLLATLLLCIGIPLLFVKDEAIQPFRSSALPVIFVLVMGCIFFFSVFLSKWVYKKFSMIMKKIESRFRLKLAVKILRIYEDCSLYTERRELILMSFIPNIIYMMISFIYFNLLFISLGVNLPPSTILWIAMLVLLVTSVPISIGGIGVRETSFAWLLTLYGIDPEKGVILGGMIFIHLILNVIIGAVFNIRETGRLRGQ